MFKISTEFRKGVLFVRLKGMIDNEGYLENISHLVEVAGIQCIVLNLDHLNNVSLESINHIIRYQKKILKEKKKLFICDATHLRNRLFDQTIPNIQSEIDAFSLI